MSGEKKYPIVVAQIMGKMNGGGVEAVIMNYYRHIDRSKVQFDFICDEDSTNIPREEIESLGGNVILCPPYQKLGKYMKFLENLFREKKYRIVHSNINTLSVFPLRAAKKAGVPVRIAHSHSASNPLDFKKNIAKNVLKIFSKKYATNLFACSMHAGVYQFGKRASAKNNIKVITNGIEVALYEFSQKNREEIRRKNGIRSDDYVVGYIGRLEKSKNIKFLIDAFSLFKAGNKNAKLMIIGDGKLFNKIYSRVCKMGIEESVYFKKYQSNANEYYSAMDIFAFPSLYEGLGMVAIEAQINGLAVLASKNIPNEANIGGIIYKSLSKKMFLEKSCRIKTVDKDLYDINNRKKELEAFYVEMGEI